MSMVPIANRASRGPPFRVTAIRCVCLVLILLAAGMQSASAQRVRGRLLDLETNRPIRGGVLTLHAADSSIVGSASSDADGRWRLDAPRPGAYFIAVRRLGYRPWMSGAMQIDAGAELDPVFHLRPQPVLLDPIASHAAAIRQDLADNGFFERQRGNFGHFLTPEEIDRRQAARITDLLTAIPGVQVVVGSGNVGPAQIVLRGSGVRDGALCRPRVFVDGLMYARGDARPVRVRESNATERTTELEQRMDQALVLDDIGHPSTIAGIEIYRSATQVPVQFGGTSVETLCGVIVVWTRTGRTPAGKP